LNIQGRESPCKKIGARNKVRKRGRKTRKIEIGAIRLKV